MAYIDADLKERVSALLKNRGRTWKELIESAAHDFENDVKEEK